MEYPQEDRLQEVDGRRSMVGRCTCMVDLVHLHGRAVHLHGRSGALAW